MLRLLAPGVPPPHPRRSSRGRSVLPDSAGSSTGRVYKVATKPLGITVTGSRVADRAHIELRRGSVHDERARLRLPIVCARCLVSEPLTKL